MSGCRSEYEWRDTLTRPISPPELTELASHLESCFHCSAILDRLAQEAPLAEPPDASPGNAGTESPTRMLIRLREDRATAKISDLPLKLQSPIPPIAASPMVFLSPPKKPDELGWLGPYRVLKKLGEGGMGMVFAAEDTSLRRAVALKIMHPQVMLEPDSHQRFLREARAAASLQHDHIVTIYQVGTENSVPFMAMQLLRGQTLDSWLRSGKPMTVGQAVRIVRQVAEALAVAHEKGLVHRDIKPANLWLEAPNGRVKVLDFGLARNVRSGTALTLPGEVVGTPSYMSPEQGRGQPLDFRTDLFSLGVVLYQLLSGELPFQAPDALGVLASILVDQPPNVATRNPQIPEELAEWTMRLLEKPAANRADSTEQVALAMKRIERQLRNGASGSSSGLGLSTRTASDSGKSIESTENRPKSSGDTLAVSDPMVVIQADDPTVDEEPASITGRTARRSRKTLRNGPPNRQPLSIWWRYRYVWISCVVGLLLGGVGWALLQHSPPGFVEVQTRWPEIPVYVEKGNQIQAVIHPQSNAVQQLRPGAYTIRLYGRDAEFFEVITPQGSAEVQIRSNDRLRIQVVEKQRADGQPLPPEWNRDDNAGGPPNPNPPRPGGFWDMLKHGKLGPPPQGKLGKAGPMPQLPEPLQPIIPNPQPE
ncbi:serine/threonine-protein kinase [Tuwongella immobilis]|uniref:non-specific serine/threonine protein kinase n=1 Tax=Tuwongella immobilis TaxID=692036 RepID=A0A6C2YI85_9BACT|nr:serine/threonine-protein kinase [Tuwongella immobilis]VIP01248.1 serine threonine protein partial : Uncultured bacterium genome assembly Metasoil_fosmids_resub OS=uncultured bacterium PE=4 SV=1: Pkinase [Tuwongella immobilis]VTR97922.1 serine threonine protein partial : Uncultured bacterium genome assembly Metasoil_fosmids_resub OS=uncultured bacterium PE=4 SV=1: Pkinase [Tuwongella immobilis]